MQLGDDLKVVVNFSGPYHQCQIIFRNTKCKIHSFLIFQGTHTLKWVYRKRCFSFGTYSYIDKAFIRSIMLVSPVMIQWKLHFLIHNNLSHFHGLWKESRRINVVQDFIGLLWRGTSMGGAILPNIAQYFWITKYQHSSNW